MDVSVIAVSGFHAPQDIAGILAQVFLNERTGFQLQRVEVTDSP